MTCQGIDKFNLNLIHIIGIDIFFMFQQLIDLYQIAPFTTKSFVFESWKNEPDLINLCPTPLYFYFRIYTVAKI